MRVIKTIAIAVVLLLRVFEVLFPFGVAMMFYAYSPQTRRLFASDEQQQLFRQIHSAVYEKGQTVFYFGIATIVIRIFLLVADRRKKTMPNKSLQATATAPSVLTRP